MIKQSKNCTCCFNIFTHCVAEILPKKHSCPPNWTSFGSSCYLVNPNPKSYKDAAVSSIATYFLNNHSSCYTMRTLLKVFPSLSIPFSLSIHYQHTTSGIVRNSPASAKKWRLPWAQNDILWNNTFFVISHSTEDPHTNKNHTHRAN